MLFHTAVLSWRTRLNENTLTPGCLRGSELSALPCMLDTARLSRYNCWQQESLMSSIGAVRLDREACIVSVEAKGQC